MKILFLVNHEYTIYNYRFELVERLLNDGCEVLISSPSGKCIEELVKMGCKHINVNMLRHGTNPLDEMKLFHYYNKLLKQVIPDYVFSYTIKPNIYGAMACKKYIIPCIVNITGLGMGIENGGVVRLIINWLYRIAFSNVQRIFVQNRDNEKYFIKHKIGVKKLQLIPGSGVNIEKFNTLDYPRGDTIEFAYISRIMTSKGVNQYLEAAKILMKRYINLKFHVCGFCEEKYENILNKLTNDKVIIYHGDIQDVREVLKVVHCVVHPTFYPEGMSNVLLESAACARPIITTNRSGCRETVEDNVNGFLVKEKDSVDLIRIIEIFIALPYEKKRSMGLAGRKKVEKDFDRQIVIEKYLQEINAYSKKGN